MFVQNIDWKKTWREQLIQIIIVESMVSNDIADGMF